MLVEAFRSLYGAYRLACRDIGGLTFFNTTVAGAWRSFFAAVLVAPFYFGLLATSPQLQQLDIDPGRLWVVQIIAYVISWTAYPVAMAALTERFGRGERFVPYLVVYNWASVLQGVIFLPVEMVKNAAVLPSDVGNLLWFAVFGAVLAYFWFIARTVLSITALAAVAVVGLDLAIGILISIVADTLY